MREQAQSIWKSLQFILSLESHFSKRLTQLENSNNELKLVFICKMLEKVIESLSLNTNMFNLLKFEETLYQRTLKWLV